MKEYFRQFKNLNRNIPKSSKIIYGIIFAVLLMGILKKIIEKPEMLLMFLGLYTALVPAEVFRGWIATTLCDPTPKIWRKISFNPIKHLNVLGIITPIFLLLTSNLFIVGWVKPVPINYNLVKNKKMSFLLVTSTFFINTINVIIAIILIKLLSKQDLSLKVINFLKNFSINDYSFENILFVILMYVITINVSVILFNLLPIPPFEMSKIISLMSYNGRYFMESMEKFSFLIIIAIFMFGLVEIIFIQPYFIILNTIFNLFGLLLL